MKTIFIVICTVEWTDGRKATGNTIGFNMREDAKKYIQEQFDNARKVADEKGWSVGEDYIYKGSMEFRHRVSFDIDEIVLR